MEQLRVRLLNQHNDFQTLRCCGEIHIFLHVYCAQMKCLTQQQQQQGLSAQAAVGDTAPQSPSACLLLGTGCLRTHFQVPLLLEGIRLSEV